MILGILVGEDNVVFMAGSHSEVNRIVLQNTLATDFVCWLLICIRMAIAHSGISPKERPIIFDDVALFG
jgi:hypothetical protein